MSKWICKICGYVHEGETAPEQCPICKAPASQFEKVEEEKKSKYFTDNLSKLDKSKRKLVGQIMGIVSQIAPENIAEEIQAAIEKEFR